MRRVVDLGERLEIEMRIDLGGRDAGVAEHLLHRAQVLRRLQDVRREGVAQHVRMHVLAQAAGARPCGEACSNYSWRYTFAARTAEQGLFRRRPRPGPHPKPALP